MIHILIYIVGIYSNIQFIFNFLKLGACAGNPQDRKGTLRKLQIYGVISFIFNMWILGRIIAFLFALTLLIATLGVTVFSIVCFILFGIFVINKY